jgi:iron complex outermembrane receptor protein
MLSGTLALYKTRKSNVLTSDPVHAGFSMAIGSAESKGVELDVNGELPWGFRLWLSYAYTDAYFANSLLDPDFGRLLPAGSPLINIPANEGSILVTHDFTVEGHTLTVGGGINYVDKRLGETGTSFYLPSYTLVRLLGSYEVVDNFVVSAEITNLFDQVYYPSSYAQLWVNPGAPREFSLKGTYHF